jgi:hypothetical protein
LDSVIEIRLIFRFLCIDGASGAVEGLQVVALLSEFFKSLQLQLSKLNYLMFTEICKTVEVILSFAIERFGQLDSFTVFILHFADVLLICPFQLRPIPLTFASEPVDRKLKKLECYILPDPLGWLDFVLSGTPCFASLWVISNVVGLLSGVENSCHEIEMRFLPIVKFSMQMVSSFSFHSLNTVSSLWVETVTFLAESQTQHWIEFAFIALKCIDDALVLSREKDFVECNCYFFQFLERLLVCPFFHITLCQFDDFIGHQLFPASPPSAFCFLKCLQAVFAKTGYGTIAQTMFACPSWLTIIGIAKFCVGCFSDAHLATLAHACIDCLIENPFCCAILAPFEPELGAWSRRLREVPVGARSVLELQLAVNRLVPSRVAKLELALLVLHSDRLQRASEEEILAFLNGAIRNSD